ELAQRWTNGNNTMGSAMINELITKLANKLEPGRKFSGVIVPKYLAHVKEAPGKRIGKATVSGQALREGHHYKLILYDRFEDVQATSAQLNGVGYTKGVPDFIVGNEHKETLEEMLSSNCDPRHMTEWQAERKANAEGAASLREDFDAIFDVLSGNSGMGSTYRRMLLLGPIDVGSDESVLRALTDPHAFRNDLNWLEGNISEMPQDVRTAYFNFTNRITKASKEDSALLVAAIYQHKLEKSKGLIGQFRDDAFMLEKLPADHAVFTTVDTPDLDKRFTPVKLYKDAQVPDERLSLREKMRQEFVTRAEALALMQVVPVYKAREAFNRLQADKYMGANFPQLLADALTVARDEAARYKDAKVRDVTYEPRMLKHEYKDVREAAALIDYAGNHMTTESQREALLRLLPMTRSQRTLASIYLVATKARLGKDQRGRYVPAAEFGNDTAQKIARIKTTPIGPSRDHALNQEAHAAGRQHMTVAQHHSLASLLDNDELIAPKLAEKNKDGMTLLDAVYTTASMAQPVDEQTRKRIDYLHGLQHSPLAVTYDGLRTDGCLKQSRKPGFDIGKYVGAKFLFKDQKDAIDDWLTAFATWIELVRAGIIAGGGSLDNTAITQASQQFRQALASALSTKIKGS
ncbi:MAG: hypothetical protein AABY13_00825, partial [Nanoarchaeota archaeon]